MNVERLLKLASVIEREELEGVQFDMANWIKERSCGTAACIAGHVAIMVEGKDVDPWDAEEIARDWLELSDETARALFTPESKVLVNATAPAAARALRHLAATGKVDWPRALRSEAIDLAPNGGAPSNG